MPPLRLARAGKISVIHDVYIVLLADLNVAMPVPLLPQVKDKMLYAATKATIKKAFSSGIVIDDIAATHKVSYDTLGGGEEHRQVDDGVLVLIIGGAYSCWLQEAPGEPECSPAPHRRGE